MANEKTEYKNLKVPLELHTRIKAQAAESNQSMISYLSQCIAQCKSDKKQ